MEALRGYWAVWDEQASQKLFQGVELVFGEDIRGRTSRLAKEVPHIIRSPALTMAFSAVYIVFVLAAKVLVKPKDKTAKGKDPSWLRMLVFMHNVFLVVLSAYMSAGICSQVFLKKYKFWGQPYNENDTELARFILIFALSKLYEYLDTVIMVLKGNMHQVTFLHCYHHVFVSIFWWMAFYLAPGGDAWFSAALNSLVHTLMYTYYLLASVSSKNPAFRKRYLWWGRYLTTFQMLQFVANSVQTACMYIFETYPAVMAKFGFYFMISLLVLFGNFYVNKYKKPEGKLKKK